MKHKNTFVKKLTALVLCLCMVLPMVTTGFAPMMALLDGIVPQADAYETSEATYGNEYYVPSGTQFFTQFTIATKDGYNWGNWDDNIKEDLNGGGFTAIETDLNNGAGGHYIFMGYKKGTDQSKAIRRIAFLNGSSRPETYTYNGAIYYRVNGCWDDRSYTSGTVDLNRGAGGDDITMYYTTDPAAGPPMSNIDWENDTDNEGNECKEPAVWMNTNSYGNIGKIADLNANAGGDYIYFFYKQTGTEVETSVLHASITNGNYYIEKKADYVSVSALETAVNNAKTIVNDYNADGLSSAYDQTAINNAVTAITNAIAGLQTKVYYNGNGGTVSQSETTITIGGEASASHTPAATASRAGYTFLGWSTDKNATSGASSVTVGCMQTVYAVWKANNYILYFNPMNGTVDTASKTVTYDAAYGDMPTPTREGYTFTGWYYESGCTNVVKSSDAYKTAGDSTVYAGWQANKYELTIDSAKGVNQTNLLYPDNTGGTVVFNPNGEHTFSGGGSDISYNGTFRNDGIYIEGNYKVVANGNTGNALLETTTTLPVWVYLEAGKTYEFSFTASNDKTEIYLFKDGSSSVRASLSKHSGNNYSGVFVVGENNTANTGDTTWHTVENATGYYQLRLDQNHNLTTLDGTSYNYSVSSFVIREVTADAKNYYKQPFGSKLVLKAPVRDGYTFDGWTFDGTQYGRLEGNVYTFGTNNDTLKANWSKNSYTLTYKNGTDETAIPYDIDSAITIADAPEKIGYTFTGWKLDAAAGNWNKTLYNAGEALNGMFGNVSLVAQWEKNSYTYTVHHMQMNLDGETYTLESKETVILNTGDTHTFAVKNYPGFTAPDAVTVTVDGTGELTVVYEYKRNKYNVTLVAGTGVASVDGAGQYLHDAPLNIKATPKTGYSSVVWTDADGKIIDLASYKVTGDVTLTASASANDVQYKVVHHVENADGTFTDTTETLTTKADASVSPAVRDLGAGFNMPAEQTVTVAGNGSTVVTYEYTRKEFTITFDHGNGATSTATLKYGAPITYPTGLVKEGYSLADPAWDQMLTTMPAYSITIKAVWDVNKYDVIYIIDGEEAAKYKSVSYGTEVPVYTAPDVPGYTFAGWDAPIPESMPDKALVFRGSYTLNTYTISYDCNEGDPAAGGSYPSSYTVNSAPFTITDPVRQGWRFTGWTDNGTNLGTNLTIDPAKTDNFELRNLDLVASWTEGAASYTVNTYFMDTDGHYGTADNTEIITGTTNEHVSAATPEQTGFTLDTEHEGYLSSGTVKDDGSLVLNIYYKRNQYTVKLTAGTGVDSITGDGIAKNADGTYGGTFYYDSPLSISATLKDGYKVLQWSGTVPSRMPAGNVNLTASATVVTYNIEYNYAGGAVSVNNKNSYNVEDAAFTLNNPTRAGYTFAGWTGTELTEATEKVTVKAGSIGNRTYTATWTAIDYTIAYNYDGGALADGVINPETYNIETETFELNKPTKVGYAFAGWTGTGLTAATKDVTIATGSMGNRSYTATWTPSNASYTVIYYTEDLNSNDFSQYGGTQVIDSITGTGIELSKLKKDIEGFTFNEAVDKDGNILTADPAVAADSSTIVKLYYTRNSHTLTYYITKGENETAVEHKKLANVEFGATLPTVEDPDRTGYTFQGWKDYTADLTMPDKDLEILALWDPNVFNITYTLNDGAFADGVTVPKTHTYDTTTRIPAPEKYGYDFAGWETEDGKQLGKNYTVKENDFTADFTLVATWTPKATTYTVETYIMGTDGTYPTAATSVSEAKATQTDAEISAAHETKTGFKPDLTKSVVKIANADFDSTKNVLKLYYSRDQYTLTLNKGTGVASVSGAGTYYYEQPVTIGASLATGYKWLNWTNGDAEYTADQTKPFTMPAEALTLTANAEAIVYTIAVNTNGGALVSEFTKENYIVTDAEIPVPDATREGYIFNGWKVNGSVAQKNYTINPANAVNVDLVADWTAVKYKITYVLSGGSNDSNPDFYTIESDTITLADPVRTGYTFVKWIEGNTIVAGSTGDRTFTAEWKANGVEYVVNAWYQDINGQYSGYEKVFMSAAADSEITASELAADAALDREGFRFVEAKDIANNVIADFTVSADGDTVVNLYFARNSYSIAFDANGGTGSMSRIENVYYGTTVQLPANNFTRLGYEFTGWNTEPDGSGKSYEDQGIYELNLDHQNGHTIPLYAQWEIVTYNITVNNFQPEAVLPEGEAVPATYTVEDVVELPTPIWAGYTFAGWYCPQTGETYVNQLPDRFTGNITLEPKWSAKLQNWHLDVYYMLPDGRYSDTPDKIHTNLKQTDGVTGVESDGRAFTGSEISVPEDIFVQDGFRYDDDGSFTIGLAKDSSAGELHLVVRYAREEFDAVYKYEDDNGPQTIVKSALYGAAFPTIEDPKRTGYTFMGWGSALPETMPANDVSLEAEWQINQYTIFYYDTDGTTLLSSVKQDYKSVITPFVPEKAGYNFVAWNKEEPSVMPAADTALIAEWSIINYPINYNLNSGTNADENPATYTVEDYVELKAPTKTGYTFAGWSDNGIIGKGSTGVKTFTAEWTPNTDTKYTVNYWLQPVDGATDTALYTKSEKSFVGQGTTATNSVITLADIEGFTKPKATAEIYVSADGSAVVDFYYTRNQYEITFDTLGGSAVDAATYYFEAAVTAPAVAPTRTGYTFDGWDALPETMPAKDVTATARWTANSYDIEYKNTENADAFAKVTAHTYGKETGIDDLTRPGYTFNGWIVNGAGAPVKGLVLAADGYTDKITLTADWSAHNQNYYVEIFYQDADNIYSYTGTETLTLTAKTDEVVTFVPEAKAGFVYNPSKSAVTGTIPASGDPLRLEVSYDRRAYTLTWDVEGVQTTESYLYGQTISYPAEPTKEGYSFIGWTPADVKTMPAADLTLKAQFAASDHTAYKVIHKFEALDGNDELRTELLYGTTNTTVTPPVLTGNDIIGFTAPAAESLTILPDGSAYVEYYYTRNSYSLTVDVSDTGLVSDAQSTTVKYGAKVELAVETADGYKFDGWTVNGTTVANTAVQALQFNMPANDVSLTAAASAIVYNITYADNQNGTYAEGEVNPNTYTVETESFTLYKPTKRGYTFLGWTGSNGAAAQETVTVAKGTFGDLAYTANWQVKQYTITYDYAGGSVAVPNPTSYTVTGASFKLNNPTRPGYDFAGWKGTDLTEAVTDVIIEANSIGNRSYIATWTAKEIECIVNYNWQNIDDDGYTLHESHPIKVKNDKNFAPEVKTYEGFKTPAAQSIKVENGVPVEINYNYDRETHTVELTAGTGIASVSGAGTYRYGAAVTVNAVVADGYTWKNWTSGDAVRSEQTEYPFTMGTADVSLQANATLDIYEITYNGLDNYTTIEENPKNYNVHSATIVLNNPAKDGYTFKGWTGTGLNEATMRVEIPAGSLGNRTYTATWNVITYELNYDLAGGMLADGESIPATFTVESTFTLPTPVRTGYDFAGWYDGTTTVNTVVFNRTTEDRFYTAKWTPRTDTAYIVNHFYMDIYGNYAASPSKTDDPATTIGTTGATIKFAPNAPEGFFADYATNEKGEKTESFVINADGTSVVNYYYSRNQYTLTYYTVANELLQKTTYYFGEGIPEAPTAVREGHTFTGWNAEIPRTMPAHNVDITAQWDINQYTITFANTGDTVIAPITQNYGTAISAPADPTRVGYTFNGWDVAIPATMPAENLTITAKWTVNSYTITFDTAGGTEIAPITADYGTAITRPANPTKTGYTFGGWNVAIPATMPATDMTITALWTVNQYTITFADTGDSTIAPITADYGTAITKPADPSRRGYRFTGWDIEIPSVMPANNVTVRATWQTIPYTITFDAGKGTVSPTTKSYTVEDAITLLPVPTRAGFTFEGWLDANNLPVTAINKGTIGDMTLTAKWSANEQTYTVKLYYMNTVGTYGEPEIKTFSAKTDDIVSFNINDGNRAGFTADSKNSSLSGTIPGTGTLTLTAYYIRDRYTVTYNFANGTALQKVEDYFEAQLADVDTPDRTGYTFLGWFDANDNQVDLPETMPLGGGTYTAKWSTNGYTLTLLESDGTPVKSISYSIEADSVLPDMSKAGYFFRGWKVTAADGAWALTDANYAAGEPLKGKHGNATLTADWTTVQYTLTFVTDKGSVDPPSITYTVENVTDVLPTPVRAGYTFAGWLATEVKDDTMSPGYIYWIVGETYPAGKALTNTYGNASFLAQWTENTYSVTASAANITFEGAATATVDADYTATLTPHAGYKLPAAISVTIGGKAAAVNTDYTWSVNEDGIGTLKLNGASIIGDVKISVAREIITYTIKYTYADATTIPANPATYNVETESFSLIAPKRVGYTFLGWTGSNGETAETAVTIDKGSVGNRSYVANWSANLNDCVVEHYKQDIGATGWTLADSKATQQYTDTVFAPEVKSYEGFTAPSAKTVAVDGNGKVVIRYEYTRNQYELTVDGSAGVSVAAGTTSVWYDEAVNISAQAIMGYTWAGWTVENVTVDDTTVNALSFRMPAKAVSLTANATLDHYDIAYDLAGGTVNGTNPDGYDVTTPTFTLLNPEKAGYTFLGWTGTDITTPATTVTIANNSTTGDKTYTANWQVVKYAITYTMNGGDNNTANPGTYTVEDSVLLQTPTKHGYTFLGWTNTATGDPVTEIKAGTTGAIGLTANWKPEAHFYTLEIRYMTTEGKYAQDADYREEIASETDAKVSYTPVATTGFELDSASNLSGTVTADDKLVLKVYYSRNQYALTLIDEHAGIAAVNTKTSLVYYKAPVEVTAVVADGYTFEKWTSADEAVLAGSTSNPYTFEMPANAVTLTASATLNTYSIRYTMNDGVNASSNPTSYTVLDTVVINPPAKLGYTFTGWSGDYSTANDEVLTIPAGKTGDINLIANWSLDTYTVSYKLDGGTVNGTNPASYNVHDSFTLINPTKTGYVFAGWTGSLEGENVTVEAGTTGNLTFTANWTARNDTKYTVNYWLMDIPTDGTVKYTLSADSFVGEGVSDADVTPAVMSYEGFGKLNAQTKKISADGTTVFDFYYQREKYTYTYKAFGYEDDVRTFWYAAPVSKPSDPVREGYTFEGWSPVVSATMPAANMVSVATWKAVSYTIGYSLGGGTAENRTSYTVEDSFTLTQPTKYGYTFLGWTGSNGDTRQMTVEIAPGSTGNRSYTAHWEATRYEIEYNLDGGTDNGENPLSYTIEDSITLVNPVKPGYRFLGWKGTGIAGTSSYVTFNGQTGKRTYTAQWTVANNTPYTVKHYQQDIGANTYSLFETEVLTGTTLTTVNPLVKTYPGFTAPAVQSLTILPDGSASVEYYYTRNNYTIYFDSNGGTPVASQTYAFDEAVTAPAAPSLLGYTFAGWTPALPEKMTAGNIYVTASWVANSDTPYTVYHYYQDTDCVSYPDSLMETEYCYGETNAVVEAATRDKEGFTSPATRTVVIAADGSRTVRYYYTRNTYTVTFVDHNDQILDLQSVVYGLAATAPALADRAPDADGHYTFLGWSEDISFIHGYTTIKAMYSAEAHNPGADATCTEGLYCVECGYEIAAADGHMPVVQIPAVDPTCDKPGNTADSVCSVCGEVLSRYKVIPALGHDIGSWYVDVPATTTETGILKRVCSRCDWHETHEIPVLSDTPVVDIDITTSGSQAYVGSTYQLVTAIKPANAGNKQVLWESSDPDIASVTADGMITSHKPGSVTFTVTTLDGLKTDSITINFFYSADNYNLIVVDLFACELVMNGKVVASEGTTAQIIRVKAGDTLAFTLNPTTAEYLNQGGYILTANGSNVAPDANGVYYIYNVHENIEISALPTIGKPEFDDDQQYDTDEVPEKSIFAKILEFFERIMDWFRNLFK